MGVRNRNSFPRSVPSSNCALRSVRNTPGAMALTQIPLQAHSMAKDLVSEATAALLAEYAATSYNARNDEIEAIFTMRPYRRSIMWGANTWQASRVPVRLVSR